MQQFLCRIIFGVLITYSIFWFFTVSTEAAVNLVRKLFFYVLIMCFFFFFFLIFNILHISPESAISLLRKLWIFYEWPMKLLWSRNNHNPSNMQCFAVKLPEGRIFYRYQNDMHWQIMKISVLSILLCDKSKSTTHIL